jgi:hypothetical protein
MELSITNLLPVQSSDPVYAASEIYRTASTAGSASVVYKAVYTWSSDYSHPGIIRLVVLPHFIGGASPVAANDFSAAIADGSFVTVVLDNQPPGLIVGGSASLSFGGAASVSSGVYNFNSTDNKMMQINTNFSGIADISGEGVLSATPNRPRTMDARENVFWQYRIQRTTGYYESGWIPLLTTSSPAVDLTTTGLTNSTATRKVEVRYRDSLENTSPWTEMGIIRYYDSARDVWAIHNPLPATPTEAHFFYQGADRDRDRRLRRVSETDASVTLYFYIPGTTNMPNRVRIAEIDYAALNGNDINTVRRDVDFD